MPANCAPLAGAADAPSAPVAPAGPVGRRNRTVPPDAGGCAAPPRSAGGIVAVPSARADSPSGWTTASPGSAARASRGSAVGGAPQDTRRSCSPPKPDCWERSAPHAAAGSGLLPCCASAGLTRRGSAAGRGSSSKKCGPVSSAGAGAGAGTEAVGRVPDGGVSGTPSEGAGRLVPVPRRHRSSTGHIQEWRGPGNTLHGAGRHRGPGLGRSCPSSRICSGVFGGSTSIRRARLSAALPPYPPLSGKVPPQAIAARNTASERPPKSFFEPA